MDVHCNRNNHFQHMEVESEHMSHHCRDNHLNEYHAESVHLQKSKCVFLVSHELELFHQQSKY